MGAHPDDLEILCGGTLARFAARGDDVVMCHATMGDRGSFAHTSVELARVRGEEAARAAAVIGARHASLGIRDGDVNAADGEQRRLVIDLVRESRPDLILTHSPRDYLGDHNETSKLVFESSFRATLPLYETGKPHHPPVTPMLYMDTVSGLGFAPAEFVDVSGVIDRKVAMIEAHESQLAWLRQRRDVDLVEQMTTAARFRGNQCGVAYAEAFAPCLTWLRARPYRLLP